MKILIFHGYLLRGTGSNIYNANLAQALARLGHDVHLLCQDRDAEKLEWVDRIGTWDGGELAVEDLRSAREGGTVAVYRPPIGDLLPVYVEDPYEGFEARAFPRLSEEEVEHYIKVNVSAVQDVLLRIGGHDAALANHLIMGPVIFARAGVRPYAVKNHGSDLEYIVKPFPRFVPFAKEGLEPAAAVLVGSHHTAASLWEAVPGLDLESKTGMGPPGVDTDEFKAIPADRRTASLIDLAERIDHGPPSTVFGREEEDAVNGLREYAAAAGPRVMFVGKMIVSKGVDLAVAAWPLVHAANPGARLLLIGFGAYEAGLRALVTALGEGDLDAARHIAEEGRALEGGEAGPLTYLMDFLDSPPEGYREAAIAANGSISFGGRFEHDEVAGVLPASDAMVVPSTFPEAFGMVAAEGASCGVLPICAEHSGLAEVTKTLSDEVPAAADLIGFDLGPRAVSDLADRINGWLALEPSERAAIGRDIADSADRNWSWQGVARDVISASAGQVRPVLKP
ncbi:MAG TPA: glycosyltransferase family 4 protein [Solirubrobacterales bacterium]|nr:glycosyltransferase family 4 protein [Solirubrobacterales bacterium]